MVRPLYSVSTMVAAKLLLAMSAILLGCHGCTHDNHVITQTTSGEVRGEVDVTKSPAVTRFLGIPYAKAPVGNLRFRPPQEPERWLGVKDMLTFGKRCLYYSSRGINWSKLGEDCLVLNVYTPQAFGALLPVMVWIHGGGYTVGTGNIYDGSILAQNGVVVVTINYRLDMFGFLSMEDNSLPGNYGMLDQVAALKWVKNNIVSFGGDPNQVTIFGESAGASSVDHLILSPLAKGLFQRAILQSGVAFSPWGFQHPGNRVSARMIAEKVAIGVNCTGLDDPVKLLSCLQNADAESIITMSNKVSRNFDSNFIITPRVETTFGFLPELPQVLLGKRKFNQVDTIHGFCSDESEYFLSRSKDIKNSQNDAEKTEKTMRYWLKQLNDADEEDVYQQIRQRFTVQDPVEQEKQSRKSQDLIGFLGPIISRIKLQSMLAAPERKHYLYEFSYRPSYSKYTSQISATHADTLRFVFGFGLFSRTKLVTTADDNQVLRAVTEMWTNFAKTGNPVSTLPTGVRFWRPYTKSQPWYLVIKPEAEINMLFSSPDPLYKKYAYLLDGVKLRK